MEKNLSDEQVEKYCLIVDAWIIDSEIIDLKYEALELVDCDYSLAYNFVKRELSIKYDDWIYGNFVRVASLRDFLDLLYEWPRNGDEIDGLVKEWIIDAIYERKIEHVQN
jgi:hypothetical protein